MSKNRIIAAVVTALVLAVTGQVATTEAAQADSLRCC
jgi:hypothetical protein